MKEKLRLKFILPLVVVALVGLAVFRLGLIDKLTGGNSSAGAVASPATQTTSTQSTTTSTDTGVAATGATETQPAAGSTTEPQESTGPTGLDRLTSALKQDAVVVVVVYSPVGAVDKLEISEARLGADDAHSGFLALDASKERAIADFAETYDVRLTPTALVFRRGPELVKKFIEFADRDTVAQAAQDAKHAS